MHGLVRGRHGAGGVKLFDDAATAERIHKQQQHRAQQQQVQAGMTVAVGHSRAPGAEQAKKKCVDQRRNILSR